MLEWLGRQLECSHYNSNLSTQEVVVLRWSGWVDNLNVHIITLTCLHRRWLYCAGVVGLTT